MSETELKKQLFLALKEAATKIADSDKKLGFYANRKIAHLSETSPLTSLIMAGDDMQFMVNQIKA